MQPDRQPSFIRTSLAWLPASILAMLLIKVMTHQGPVVGTDSVYYFQSAENWLAGHGLAVTNYAGQTVPLSHWAPGYPFLLAILAILAGSSVMQAAGWVGIVNAGLVVFILGLWLRFRGVSPRLRAFALLALALQPDFLLLCTWAYSDSLYFVLLLLSLYLLDRSRHDARWTLLAASALIAGFSILVRYAGLAIIPCGIAILSLSRSRPNHRFQWHPILAWAIVSILPWASWSAWLILAQNVVSRKLAWHPFGWKQTEESLQVFFRWIFTAAMPWPLAALVFVLLMIASLNGRKATLERLRSAARSLSTQPGAVFSIFYLLLLMASISLFDFNTHMDFRILHPVLLSTFPLVVGGLAKPALLYRPSGRIRPVALLLPMALIGWSYQTFQLAKELHSAGRGHFTRVLSESRLLKQICLLPAFIPIQTNAPDLIEVHCHRPAIGFPEHHELESLQPRAQYQKEWDDMVRRLRDEDAVLAYWHFMHDRWTVPTMPELLEKLPLEVVDQDQLGILYRWKSPDL